MVHRLQSLSPGVRVIGVSKRASVLRAAHRLFDREAALRDANYLHVSLVLDKTIRAIGCNLPFKTHPLAQEYGYEFSLHSEFVCALGLPSLEDLAGATMVNVLLRRRPDGSRDLGLAAPCSLCQRFLADFGIRQVIFTVEDSWEVWRPGLDISHYTCLCRTSAA